MGIDPKMAMAMMQGGGGGMPQGGGGLEQLMQMAGPLLQGMGPNAKAQLGAAMQTPGVQQMVTQMLSNPQVLQQIFAMATQGMGPAQSMNPQSAGVNGPGPATDNDLSQMDALQDRMRGGIPDYDKKGPDYAVPENDNESPQSTEQELQMLQQMMNRART